MLLSEEITLPCGLRLPNRLSKVASILPKLQCKDLTRPQAAMAEAMSPSHNPDEKFQKLYGEWADGGWGLLITGDQLS